MPDITMQEVKHVAKLAHLALSVLRPAATAEFLFGLRVNGAGSAGAFAECR